MRVCADIQKDGGAAKELVREQKVLGVVFKKTVWFSWTN